MSLAAWSSGGFWNTEPQFGPPGWCSRRQRTISATRSRAAAGSPRRTANVAGRDDLVGREAGVPIGEAEVRRRPDRRAAGAQVEHLGGHERRRDVVPVAAGVHAHRAADRAGHADRPLEPDEPLVRAPARQHRQGHRTARAHRDGAVGALDVRVDRLELPGEHDREPAEPAIRHEQVGASADDEQRDLARVHRRRAPARGPPSSAPRPGARRSPRRGRSSARRAGRRAGRGRRAARESTSVVVTRPAPGARRAAS